MKPRHNTECSAMNQSDFFCAGPDHGVSEGIGLIGLSVPTQINHRWSMPRTFDELSIAINDSYDARVVFLDCTITDASSAKVKVTQPADINSM